VFLARARRPSLSVCLPTIISCHVPAAVVSDGVAMAHDFAQGRIVALVAQLRISFELLWEIYKIAVPSAAELGQWFEPGFQPLVVVSETLVGSSYVSTAWGLGSRFIE